MPSGITLRKLYTVLKIKLYYGAIGNIIKNSKFFLLRSIDKTMEYIIVNRNNGLIDS